MVDAAAQTLPHRRPFNRILRASQVNQDNLSAFDFSTPIDRSRWFVCPTLTPLYYAPVYCELLESHQRRYNQLTALCFSELISFFETTFAASVLAALAAGKRNGIDPELAACLGQFIEEEREHTRWWQQLNQLSEPALYSTRQRAIIRLSAPIRFLLNQITRRPGCFPLVFWVMLALEERSLEISRRCLRMPNHQIEPRYLAIYRAHLQHEVRHVQLDWHLIERFYEPSSLALRKFNAALLRLAIARFFLPPTRSARRVVRRLVAECPELMPLRKLIETQLVKVGEDPAYHAMMYSRESTPITFALFDRFKEMHELRAVLRFYEPQ
jgi:P-aminobenzoate N-oxygenase AurF